MYIENTKLKQDIDPFLIFVCGLDMWVGHKKTTSAQENFFFSWKDLSNDDNIDPFDKSRKKWSELVRSSGPYFKRVTKTDVVG